MTYARKLIAPLAAAAALAAVAAPAHRRARRARTSIAAGQREEDAARGQARGLRRRRLRDVRRHDAGLTGRRRAWRCASTSSRSRSRAAAAGPRCAASRASATGTAPTPASRASSSASASAAFSAGNAYRAVVRFRWRNPRGKVVRGAKRITARCAAARPAPRPAAAQRGRRARQRRRGLDLPRDRRQHGHRPGRPRSRSRSCSAQFGVVYTPDDPVARRRRPRAGGDQGAALRVRRQRHASRPTTAAWSPSRARTTTSSRGAAPSAERDRAEPAGRPSAALDWSAR